MMHTMFRWCSLPAALAIFGSDFSLRRESAAQGMPPRSKGSGQLAMEVRKLARHASEEELFFV